MTRSRPGVTRGEAPLPPPQERRRLREARSLTREQVAAAVGVTCNTVRSWEAGRSTPRGRKRAAYARLLEGRGPSGPSWAGPAADARGRSSGGDGPRIGRSVSGAAKGLSAAAPGWGTAAFLLPARDDSASGTARVGAAVVVASGSGSRPGPDGEGCRPAERTGKAVSRGEAPRKDGDADDARTTDAPSAEGASADTPSADDRPGAGGGAAEGGGPPRARLSRLVGRIGRRLRHPFAPAST
ncbi:helix-turn-helix transcriptional regulator, partial [Streptomyces sp. URMC 123]|uniref:helix-turn-helix transcriptional regulator n=1 Tax=Streptomyces sp. URMC 123 TaxID=3423403 RepID=UPI003F1A421E